jgi:hypothetical protein
MEEKKKKNFEAHGGRGFEILREKTYTKSLFLKNFKTIFFTHTKASYL